MRTGMVGLGRQMQSQGTGQVPGRTDLLRADSNRQLAAVMATNRAGSGDPGGPAETDEGAVLGASMSIPKGRSTTIVSMEPDASGNRRVAVN